MSARKRKPARKGNAKPARAPAPAASPALSIRDLENPIHDLVRATRVAFEMAMHDAENPDDERLGLFAVEQAERLALELRATWCKVTGLAD